jgi:OmpA-OmpF porin, OOP family
MKTVFTRTALMVVLSGLIATGFAQTTMSDTAKRYDRKSFRTWSIGLHAGVLSPFTPFNGNNNGDFRTNEAQWGYGGYIKKQILPGFGLQADFLAGEVTGFRSNALPNNTAAQDASSFRSHIDWSGSVSANLTIANLGFNHERSFLTPYLTAGAGYMSSRAKVFNTPAGATTNFEENWFIPIGAGFKLGLTKAVNIDLGYNVYFMKTNNFDGVASNPNDKFSYAHAGFEFALGRKKSSQLQNFSPVAALRKAMAQESAEMSNRLAAIEQQRMKDSVQYAIAMGDDDGDGVANKFDKCAGTPADTVVDGKGCAIKIPAPIIMAPVTQVTQVTERIIVTEEDRRVLDEAIKNLEFATGKSTIKESSFATLNKVAEILKQKNFSLKLAGHTDNVGGASANIKLSKDRAESVKAYLVGQGANASRIEATGYGAAQPIESNKTAEGRQKNRRVEFSLL